MSEDIVYTFEFIGSDLEVIDSDYRGYEELQGKVIDETKNMFVIEDERKKMIPKKGNHFRLTINGRNNVLDGNKLTHRSEDRIKKLG
ncbi:MAG: ribonuclease P protein subunit [Candidatus Thermoplasmatota archaeon]|nr:ribonuclease P protein subunit [Candidatus Thermoplasmatota archaeon]MBS3789866.1 ribonuclease P protein subunit [Candidatus Thermoplasmatota archaeon]